MDWLIGAMIGLALAALFLGPVVVIMLDHTRQRRS
jgi:hypothetical protein